MRGRRNRTPKQKSKQVILEKEWNNYQRVMDEQIVDDEFCETKIKNKNKNEKNCFFQTKIDQRYLDQLVMDFFEKECLMDTASIYKEESGTNCMHIFSIYICKNNCNYKTKQNT